MSKELAMTDYLKGLRDLFIKYNITEVYTEYKFSNEKEDGVVLYVNGDREALNAVTDYIDKIYYRRCRSFTRDVFICIEFK